MIQKVISLFRVKTVGRVYLSSTSPFSGRSFNIPVGGRLCLGRSFIFICCSFVSTRKFIITFEEYLFHPVFCKYIYFQFLQGQVYEFLNCPPCLYCSINTDTFSDLFCQMEHKCSFGSL